MSDLGFWLFMIFCVCILWPEKLAGFMKVVGCH